MPAPAFVQLVGRLVEEFGQSVGAVRRAPEGIRLTTTDGFLYAFLEDASALSLGVTEALLHDSPGGPRHLVIFSAPPIASGLVARLHQAGATVVEGARFEELLRMLGLTEYIGLEPTVPARRSAGPKLPSAASLDTIMQRARTWLEWGVPALALRFFRQATDLKPEFLPARVGAANALLGLQLTPDARRSFEAILARDRGNLDARVGLAAVLGVEGRTAEEIAGYRALLGEDPERVSVRAHLIAALLEHRRWAEAREEIDQLLARVPEDAQLRFLRAVTLHHTGNRSRAEQDRIAARRLGLPFDREAALAERFGIAPPSLPEPPVPPPPEELPAVVAGVVHPVEASSRPRRAPRRTRPARPRPPPRRRRSLGRKRK